MEPLTPNEKKILDYIQNYSDENGYSPTYSEIQDEFGYKAINSVQQYIKQLTAKGYLRKHLGENKKRALELEESSSEDITRVHLEGVVAAGHLTEAVHNREFVEIPTHLLKSNREYFALTVKGDSMIEDCIMSGDLVIVERLSHARNGQTVVAMVGDEATLKKYYKRKSHVELHPANPDYPIIKIKDENFKILGVLAHVLRSYV